MIIREVSSNEEYPMDLLLLADPSEKIIREYLRRGQCFIAERNNKIIGTYILLPTRPETIELVNIAVAENEQNKGIGQQLVIDAMTRAREKGYRTMEVGTGNSGAGQLILYQKCGFRINGVDKDFFVRHYEEEIFENGIQCRDMVRLSQDL